MVLCELKKPFKVLRPRQVAGRNESEDCLPRWRVTGGQINYCFTKCKHIKNGFVARPCQTLGGATEQAGVTLKAPPPKSLPGALWTKHKTQLRGSEETAQMKKKNDKKQKLPDSSWIFSDSGSIWSGQFKEAWEWEMFMLADSLIPQQSDEEIPP